MIDKHDFYLKAKEFGVELADSQLVQFDLYAQLLVEWNSKINLTAIVDPKEIVIKHFLDSISVFSLFEFPQGSKLIDVGAGAGFPSTPIVIVRPDLQIMQMDSLHKRISFLDEVSYCLGLKIQTVHQRAELGGQDPIYREQYDFVVARAVAQLPVLCEYCLPFVKPGGSFVVWKGYEIQEELDGSAKALALLGGEVNRVEKLVLPGNHKRSMVFFKKISQTPTKFPRTAAKIKKSPLI